MGYLTNDNRVFLFKNNPVLTMDEEFEHGIINAKGIQIGGDVNIYFTGLNASRAKPGNEFARIFLTKLQKSVIANILNDRELWYENINK